MAGARPTRRSGSCRQGRSHIPAPRFHRPRLRSCSPTSECRAVCKDTESPIPSLNAITNHDYPKFDTDIPDLYRYDIWRQDFEKNRPANLNMFWLPSDHTGRTPDPQAQVADNELAVGKMVQEISHSLWHGHRRQRRDRRDEDRGADRTAAQQGVAAQWAGWAKVTPIPRA